MYSLGEIVANFFYFEIDLNCIEREAEVQERVFVDQRPGRGRSHSSGAAMADPPREDPSQVGFPGPVVGR